MTVARAELVIAARRWIGTPFHHQASLCQIGCDCLGLVRGVWREVIGPEPEETPPYGVDWAATKRADHLKDALARHFHSHDKPDYRAGDVLLLSKPLGTGLALTVPSVADHVRALLPSSGGGESSPPSADRKSTRLNSSH